MSFRCAGCFAGFGNDSDPAGVMIGFFKSR
jgi:hypothetical protein